MEMQYFKSLNTRQHVIITGMKGSMAVELTIFHFYIQLMTKNSDTCIKHALNTTKRLLNHAQSAVGTQLGLGHFVLNAHHIPSLYM